MRLKNAPVERLGLGVIHHFEESFTSQLFKQSETNLLWAKLVSKKSHQRICAALYGNGKRQTTRSKVCIGIESHGFEGHKVSATFLNKHRSKGFPWPLATTQLSTIIDPYHPPGPSAIECLWAPKGDAALSIPFFDARNSADAPPVLSIDCKERKRSKYHQISKATMSYWCLRWTPNFRIHENHGTSWHCRVRCKKVVRWFTSVTRSCKAMYTAVVSLCLLSTSASTWRRNCTAPGPAMDVA